MEQTFWCLEDIKETNPTLYTLIEQETSELAAVLGAQCLDIPHDETCYRLINASEGSPRENFTEATSEVYVNGVLKYPCVECGKLHDRKARANDCQNSDLGIKPYKCTGQCGDTSWSVFTTNLPPFQLIHTIN